MQPVPAAPVPWPAPTAPGPVRATVRLPGSKSVTARALVLAALAEGPSTVHDPLRARDTELMAADIPNAQPMRSAYLSLGVDSDPEAERIFATLSGGGRILMTMQETFFATRFGQVQDRFGINWMILHQRPMPPRT